MIDSIRQFGYPCGLEYQAKEQGSRRGDEELVAWPPEDIHTVSLMIIQPGRRIPEEALGPDELQHVWQNYFNRPA